MSSTTHIIYQPYTAGPRGTLKPGQAITCRTAEDGIRRAERAMAGGSIVGAQVVSLTHDDDAGEFGDPHFLGRVGKVPDTE